MKRVIVRASTCKEDTKVCASVQYNLDPEFEDYFQEVENLAMTLARGKGFTAKITDYGEDNYGYPCAIVGIFKGSKLVEEANVGCWDSSTGDEYHSISEAPEVKEYLKDIILPLKTR